MQRFPDTLNTPGCPGTIGVYIVVMFRDDDVYVALANFWELMDT